MAEWSSSDLYNFSLHSQVHYHPSHLTISQATYLTMKKADHSNETKYPCGSGNMRQQTSAQQQHATPLLVGDSTYASQYPLKNPLV